MFTLLLNSRLFFFFVGYMLQTTMNAYIYCMYYYWSGWSNSRKYARDYNTAGFEKNHGWIPHWSMHSFACHCRHGKSLLSEELDKLCFITIYHNEPFIKFMCVQHVSFFVMNRNRIWYDSVIPTEEWVNHVERHEQKVALLVQRRALLLQNSFLWSSTLYYLFCSYRPGYSCFYL